MLTTFAALAVLGAVGWVVSVATSAPALDTIKPQDQGAASVIYSADGHRLGFISNDILRTPVTGGQIPQVARDATVAIEDRRFFEHKGVDFEGVIRAAVKNLESKDDVQGGSTLTMQLIRNLYTKDTVRTGIEGYKRKIREAKLAEELENRHPGRRGKRWILDQYLNNVPYGTVGGKTAVGIQAAARIFYDKPAEQADAVGGRAAGRPAPGAVALQPVPERRQGRGPPQRRAATHGRSGLHHPERGRPRRSTSRSASRPTATTPRSARATSTTTSSSSSSTSTGPSACRPAACTSTRR